MSANLIFETTGKLRVTQFNPAVHYDIGELNFYIPTSFGSKVQLYLVIKDTKNLYEIFELAKAGSSGNNVLYKTPLNQTLRINDEEVSIQFLILDGSNNTYQISDAFRIIINTNNYVLARQVFIAQQIGAKVQDYYAKIVQLTTENQQLYEKIQKGDN